MAAYHRMTARRRSALRKAQLASARKRSKFGKFSSATRKLSRGHKRAIAVVAAGTLLAGAGTGVWKYTSARKRPMQKPPGEAKPSRTPYNDNKGWRATQLGSGSENDAIGAPDMVVVQKNNVKVESRATHPLVRSIMEELNGEPVRGYYSPRKGGKYKVTFGS